MYMVGSWAVPSVGTDAKSTCCMGDQTRGTWSLPTTSWRSSSSWRIQSCRSPRWMRYTRRSQASASRNAVTVTTLYDTPLPWAWFVYQSSRASSLLASIGIQPSR